MAIKRSFSVTVTFQTGFGDALTLTGSDAQNFYARYQQYLSSTANMERGIEIIKSDGSACLYNFAHVASVCRTKQTETETTDGACEDLDCNLQPVSKSATGKPSTGQGA